MSAKALAGRSDQEGRLAYLDGWRGLAILLVLAGHFVPPLGFMANVGVELFFALSGRLMADLLLLRRQPVDQFLWRRATRVLPGLSVYVVTAAALMASAGLIHGVSTHWLSPFAALLFFHNFLPQSQAWPILEHSWSLAVEEHSYLVLVLLVLACARRRRWAMGAALLIAALALANGAWLSANAGSDIQPIFWRSDVGIASVLIAFAIRIALLDGTRNRAALASPMLVAGIALINETSLPDVMVLGGSALLAGLAVNLIDSGAAWWRAALSHAVLVRAGALSFSLYLWQQTFYVLVKAGAPSLPLLPLVLLCAVLSYRCVEAPARKWLNRVGPPRWRLILSGSNPSLKHQSPGFERPQP